MPGRGIARRIARLERRPGGARGPCPLCRDVGYAALIDHRRGETRENAAGCPSCARVSKYIILDEGSDA